MQYHIIYDASGTIRSQIGDTGDGQAEAHDARVLAKWPGGGVLIADAPADSSTQMVLDGQLVEVANILEIIRAQTQARLEAMHMAYIYALYSAGTQASLNMFSALVLKLQQNGVTDQAVIDAQAQLVSALRWIAAVLSYYRTIEAAIADAPDVATLNAITWDYPANVPYPDPAPRLRDIEVLLKPYVESL